VSPDEVASRLLDVVGSGSVVGGTATADVAREQWPASVAAVRDDPLLATDLLDVLLGVDLEGEGVEVVLRLWSSAGRHAVVLRTRCPADDLRVPSLSGVFAGAAWHEREVAEMLGVDVDGHPGLTPLLLPTGFVGHPLRKAFVLARRQETAWPGAVEPGHSEPDPRRQPLGAPGRRR
jgi:NADH-quinone oxidoreductase subunit C